MQVSVNEFENNIDMYLGKSQFEDISITKNGKTIAKVCNPNADRVEMAKSLIGIIDGCEMTAEEIKEERLLKK